MTNAPRRGRPPKAPTVETVSVALPELPGVEVKCIVHEVHTGDGRILYFGDKARVTEEVAAILVKLETVSRV